jgi:hypothetical protein
MLQAPSLSLIVQRVFLCFHRHHLTLLLHVHAVRVRDVLAVLGTRVHIRPLLTHENKYQYNHAVDNVDDAFFLGGYRRIFCTRI